MSFDLPATVDMQTGRRRLIDFELLLGWLPICASLLLFRVGMGGRAHHIKHLLRVIAGRWSAVHTSLRTKKEKKQK